MSRPMPPAAAKAPPMIVMMLRRIDGCPAVTANSTSSAEPLTQQRHLAGARVEPAHRRGAAERDRDTLARAGEDRAPGAREIGLALRVAHDPLLARGAFDAAAVEDQEHGVVAGFGRLERQRLPRSAARDGVVVDLVALVDRRDDAQADARQAADGQDQPEEDPQPAALATGRPGSPADRRDVAVHLSRPGASSSGGAEVPRRPRRTSSRGRSARGTRRCVRSGAGSAGRRRRRW